MSVRPSTLLSPFTVLAAVLACAGADSNAPLLDCTTAVTLEVGVGVHPDIRWTPSCGVTSLSVTFPDTGAIVAVPLWSVVSATGNFGPPVRYGTAPPGTTQYGPAAELTPGAAYVVHLTYGGRGRGAGTDTLTFTVQ